MNKATLYMTVCVIAAGLTACDSSDEQTLQPSPADYICFDLPTVNVDATFGDFADSPRSRAELVQTISEFKVWGFCVPNNVSNGDKNPSSAKLEWNDKSTFFTGIKGKNDVADVFEAMTVKNEGNGFTSYNGGDAMPWNDVSTDKEARYAFFAGYASTGGNFSVEKALQTTDTDENGNNLSHGPKLTYTLPATAGGTLTTDRDYKGQPDVLVAYKFDHQKEDGRVALSFMHIMTGLRFKFHNHTADKTLTIKKVTYAGNFYRQAVFDFTTDKPVMTVPTDQTYSGIFTLLSSPQDIPAQQAIYMGGNDSPVTFLLLPNPADTTIDDENYTLGSQKQITIEYAIGGEDKTPFVHKNFTLNYIPQPNTLHTAHFNFVGDDFVVAFQADDEKNWENGSDNNVTIH